MAKSDRLAQGDEAPPLTLTDQRGSAIDFAALWRSGGLVVFFYPKDETPGCIAEVCSFRDRYHQFSEAGVSIVGVSGDNNASHQRFVENRRLQFPLIADADGTVRKAFGVRKRFGLIPERVTFVINQRGIIQDVFSRLFDSEQHIVRALAAIQTPDPR